MTRTAGVASYATSAREDVDVVLKTLRQIADLVLFNLCKEITIICEHLKRNVVTEDILREALKSSGVRLFGSCEERHASCPSLKHYIRAAPHRLRCPMPLGTCV